MTTTAAPTVVQTAAQSWLPGQTISFTLPTGTFTDPQGETLTYSASVGLGFASLPSWLSFNPATLTFSGTVPTNEPARLSIDIIATNSSGLFNGEQLLVSTSPNPLVTADLSPVLTVPDSAHLPGTAAAFSYSFMTAAPGNPFHNGEGDGFVALSAAQQTTVQQVLAAYAAVCNVTFTQVTDSSTVGIRFGTDTPNFNYAGVTFADPSGLTSQSQVFFSNFGNQAYPFAFLALHEIANCLHLADYSAATASYIAAEGLPAADSNSSYLVGADLPSGTSSYAPQEGYYPLTTPMLLDIQALQYMYGANQSGLTAGYVTTSYGHSYQFTDYATPQCIWVGSQVGGITSFDFSQCSGPAIINLNPGSFSSTVASAPASWLLNNVALNGQTGRPTQNIAIAYGATIQEAIGNNAGDAFYANGLSDTLIGGTGNDLFNLGGGACTVYGGGGQDTAIFADPKADYSIANNGKGGLLVTETAGPKHNGAATLYDVATLQFSDQSIASSLPQLVNQTAAQGWLTHQTINFAIPSGTFSDALPLTLSASLAGGGTLPAWLSFQNGAFIGTVPAGSANLSLEVTATDSSGLQMSDFFTAAISPSLVTTAPSAVSLNAGQSNALSGISLADSASGASAETVTVTLSDQSGLLSANGAAGTQNLTLSGTLAQVNAALATLTYQGTGSSLASTDSISVQSSSSQGDSNSAQIAVTVAAPDYLTGAIAAKAGNGTILSGPAAWTIVGQASLAGASLSGSLVPSGGAVLTNDGSLTLGTASFGGFIGDNNGTGAAHGTFVNAAGATVTLVNGGISVDTFDNQGTLALPLNLTTYAQYVQNQQVQAEIIGAYFVNTGTVVISSNNAEVNNQVIFDAGGSSSANAFTVADGTADSGAQIAVSFEGPTPFVITGGTWNIYSQFSIDDGSDGGTVNISGNTVLAHGAQNFGTINVLPGVTLTSDYDLFNSGTVNLAKGATLDIVSSVLTVPNGQTVNTINFAGADAILIAGTPATFSYQLSGLTAGDLIDLQNYVVTAATVTGGNLVLSNGATQVLSIPVSGLAAGASLSVVPDGSGGTDIAVGETAAAAAAGGKNTTTVVDNAADVAAALDGLQSQVAAGQIGSIELTDGGIAKIALSAAQLANDAGVLKDVIGNFTLSIAAGNTNASINGFAGHGNSVVFGSAAALYTITPSGNGVGLTVSNGLQSDQISNITDLQFSDFTDFVASKTAATIGGVSSFQVASLYAAVLDRVPDVAGLAYYEGLAAANSSLSITTFAEYFLSSPEYVAAHSYAQTAAGDAQFITDSYNNLLRRAPEAGAVTYYTANVINPILGSAIPGTAAYTAAELLAHAAVLGDFSQSAEFQSDVQVTAQTPSSPQHWLILI